MNGLNFSLLNEEDYFNEIENIVKPYLQKYEQSSYFPADDNNKIFYKYYITENHKANIVISHGLNEFSEKYLEMIYYFLKSDYNVFFIEHRGHGYSYREVEDTSISHINSYKEYVSDLYGFINNQLYLKTNIGISIVFIITPSITTLNAGVGKIDCIPTTYAPLYLPKYPITPSINSNAFEKSPG